MKSIVAILFIIFLCFISVPAQAAVQYTVTELGTFGGMNSYASDLNNKGQVVGEAQNADGTYQAFLFDGSGPLRNLCKDNDTTSSADSINDHGQIVGYFYRGNGNQHAFLSDGTNPIQDLGTGGAKLSWAYGINNKGQIVGSTDFPDNSVIFLGNDQVKIIANSGYNFAEQINDKGVTVGASGGLPFIYDGIAPLNNLSSFGVKWGIAWDINENGLVVGINRDGLGKDHAFKTDGKTFLRNLEELEGGISEAKAINNNDQVVGWSKLSDGTYHACIWDANNTIQDLNGLIDSSLGVTLTMAEGINDRGQIVANYDDGNGQYRAFLLTPVPEPSTIALLLTATLGGLLWWRRRS